MDREGSHTDGRLVGIKDEREAGDFRMNLGFWKSTSNKKWIRVFGMKQVKHDAVNLITGSCVLAEVVWLTGSSRSQSAVPSSRHTS